MDAAIEQTVQRSDRERVETVAEENRRLRVLIAELLRSNECLRQELARR